jgi:site-specific DNA-cytosine methylase
LSGTIATVHYRVLYDDGDTETFSEREAYENIAHNNNRSSKFSMDIYMLELFSGCSLLSTLCRRKGMEADSVDNDMNSNATIKANFTGDYVQSLISDKMYDYIHASPVCSTHSRMAGAKHRSRDCYNKSTQSHDADATLMLLFLNIKHQMQKNLNCIFTIENPVGT